jgi:alpha-galactosidase
MGKVDARRQGLLRRARASLITAIALAAIAPAAHASLATTAAIAPTPPMGWSSWYHYGCGIRASLFEQTASAMARNGMAAAGYKYVNIDDCWMTRRRTLQGELQPNPNRFPDGIAGVANYVHGLGLKLGIYLDTGSATCTGFPGSGGHDAQDARTIAGWGVDALKLDFCRTRPAKAAPIYRRWQRSLDQTGRRIMLNICEWGYQNPWKWAPGIGSTWRTTGDYFSYGAPRSYWAAILAILDLNERLATYARPGAFNDPNALLVGTGVLTVPEERAQMSLWSMLAAPLIAGGDLAHLSRGTLQVLTNRDVIAVDQDERGMQGRRVVADARHQVWVRKLGDGSRVLLFLNPTKAGALQYFDLTELGYAPGHHVLLRDLWEKRTITSTSDVRLWVGPQDVRMVRLDRPDGGAPYQPPTLGKRRR